MGSSKWAGTGSSDWRAIYKEGSRYWEHILPGYVCCVDKFTALCSEPDDRLGEEVRGDEGGEGGQDVRGGALGPLHLHPDPDQPAQGPDRKEEKQVVWNLSKEGGWDRYQTLSDKYSDALKK